MARVTRFDSAGVSAKFNTGRNTRAQSESIIANNNKSLLETSLSSMTSQSQYTVDYFSINGPETTYTETLNLTLNRHKTERFTLIYDLILHGSSTEDLEDKKDTERKLAINLANKEFIVPVGSIEPKIGDHLVLKIQGSVGELKPYEVTDVQAVKYNYKEVWKIIIGETHAYTLSELMDRVVKKMNYVDGNVGSGMASLIDTNTKAASDKILAVMDALQSSYVEAFYDVQSDTLGFEPTLGSFDSSGRWESVEGTCKRVYKNQFIFNHYANDLMQQKNQVLKFGHDKNVLFVSNVYGFDRTEINYKTSMYNDLIKRKYKPINEVFAGPNDDLIQGDTTVLFKQVLALRDFILEEDDFDYEPRYSYNKKFYMRRREEHLILTPYFNTGKILVDMLNTTSFIDDLKNNYATYELKSPRICKILDLFMDDNKAELVSNLDILDELYVDKDNIDDYMGVPLLLLALSEVYYELNKDKSVGTYGGK